MQHTIETLPIITYPDGYNRRKVTRTAKFRSMLASEAKLLDWSSRELYFLATNGTVKSCRLNGKVKTWKRPHNPEVEVPVKYGLYECARLASRADGTMDSLLVKVSEWSEA